ncbi:ArsR family transcriptional regulator [Mangrovimonas sp. AS39]|uniref:GbsR/MarR family transcriptional regulator n=1 Tax=Mangrovimonas TaxID=1211036 RepID=UPI0006B56C4C|nr:MULTISPECIES: MarR family transcriptional regulator [Mangrovimonas]MCF1190684.1 ArsR family transcriptional regulator [Mangrovimonas futianensis]MCF1194381.1 ArsR family transcriptional regulator [Mangrovimonas futianensis]MCF1420127.1 ArsR family transcriptional regulator [Mangrovimonas futianensis]NIK91242.1 ArsR family transcriptional regulator [Mangrovimonas sp. CR14]
MNYQEAKEKFISTWGSLGSLWGINKAMAQIQALLFISTKPLSMEDIMEELKISRGNTSMNLRQLMDWGIVTKEIIPGERKEYFTTEKDVEELARHIAKERSRRELKPVLKVLKEVSNIDSDQSEETEELKKQTKALHDLTQQADDMLNKIADQDLNWVTKTFIKIMR